MMKKSVIYLLTCPDTGDVRYVGKTQSGLDVRLSGHLTEAGRYHLGHRGHWLRRLIAEGKKPGIRVDVEIGEGEDWQSIERQRIAHYRALGCRLVNGTEGGEGLHEPSPEVRARMSRAASERAQRPEYREMLAENGRRVGALNKGRKAPPHVGEAVAASNRSRLVTEETRAKMRAAQSARRVRKPHSDETKAKLRAAFQGRKLSKEHRAKISAGLRARKGE
jgi:hypothetical protein